MKKLKVLLSVMAMSFVMVGCGGGGDSSVPVVDNSVLADGENQYGYFGEEVIFADTKIVGYWYLSQESSGTHVFVGFQPDGESTYQEQTTTFYGDYGVSQDGRLITAQYVDPNQSLSVRFVEITYLSTSSNVSVVTTNPDGTTKETYCFNVELKATSLSGGGIYGDIVMCPS